MHGHGADEEDGAAAIIQAVGHYRSKRKAGLFSRQCRKAADAAEVQQRTGTFGEGRLGDGMLVRDWTAGRMFARWMKRSS